MKEIKLAITPDTLCHDLAIDLKPFVTEVFNYSFEE